MSQSRKKRADRRSAEQTPSQALVAGDRQASRRGYIIIISVFMVIIGLIIFFFKYQGDAPYRLTIITVDDTTIRMDYFLKRIQMAGGIDPLKMLSQLTEEQIIKLAAPRYGIEVTPEDIDETLRSMFRGKSKTFSESEFKEWYRQLLNESKLSDAEFREYTANLISRKRLHEYLAERVPTVAEQVHLYIIFVKTYDEAKEARARWEAGEDFTDLARELSLDEVTREKGGELGWFPRRGLLNPELEYEAFNLSTGNVSQPLAVIGKETAAASSPLPAITGYYIVRVSDRAAAREIDKDNLQAVKDNALKDWLSVERGNHKVKWHGFNDGFDSYTDAWVKLQMAKMAKQREQK